MTLHLNTVVGLVLLAVGITFAAWFMHHAARGERG